MAKKLTGQVGQKPLPNGWVHGKVWKLEKLNPVTKEPSGLFTEHERNGRYSFIPYQKTKVIRTVKMVKSAILTYNEQWMNTLEFIEIEPETIEPETIE